MLRLKMPVASTLTLELGVALKLLFGTPCLRCNVACFFCDDDGLVACSHDEHVQDKPRDRKGRIPEHTRVTNPCVFRSASILVLGGSAFYPVLLFETFQQWCQVPRADIQLGGPHWPFDWFHKVQKWGSTQMIATALKTRTQRTLQSALNKCNAFKRS